MEKYKQSLHIMTISFLPSYQYFETFYFLQESKWLSSNMLDYFKTWYYCLQHNICYWNQRHVWVRKFLNYSTFYWNTPKTSIYQVSKKQQHSQSVTIFMILKLTDYMKYYYATHSYKVLQTIFPRRRLCRRTKPLHCLCCETGLHAGEVLWCRHIIFQRPRERIPPDLHNLDSALFEDFLKTKYPRPVQTYGVHSKHMKQS